MRDPRRPMTIKSYFGLLAVLHGYDENVADYLWIFLLDFSAYGHTQEPARRAVIASGTVPCLCVFGRLYGLAWIPWLSRRYAFWQD